MKVIVPTKHGSPQRVLHHTEAEKLAPKEAEAIGKNIKRFQLGDEEFGYLAGDDDKKGGCAVNVSHRYAWQWI